MSELSKNLVEKRKARAKKTAEIFTPYFLVNEILDKLSYFSPEAWEKEKSFLDPACGNGNFLIFVLWRKIINLKQFFYLSSLLYFSLFFFNKWAFLNYYYFISQLYLIGLSLDIQ